MPDERTSPSILTVAEVARYLRVSETTVWRWCSRGRLPAFRIGRSWRVRRDDLETLMHRSESGSTKTPPPLDDTPNHMLHTVSEDA